MGISQVLPQTENTQLVCVCGGGGGGGVSINFNEDDWCNKGRDMCSVCGMMHIKEPLLLIEESQLVAAGFLYRYLSGPLPYVRRHITVNKMC